MALSYEEVISQIKDRLDIVDVVSQSVVLKKSGANYWGLCPFHNDKKPSFCVSPSKGIYKCFSCGEGGDALTFLLKTQNKDFKELIAELAEKFGIELPKTSGFKPQNKELKDDMKRACKMAARFYQKQLTLDKDSAKAAGYLKQRSINDSIIDIFSLGWAPNDYHKLYEHLKGSFSDEVLEKAGLIVQGKNGWIDRFRNRIIIPIQNEDGEYVAFGARAVDEGQNPKYLNSADSLIYNKRKILFGLYTAKEAIKEEDSVIIMEGYFDVISTQAHGIKNCVASCGTAFTQEHVKLLSRYTKSRRIYLSFDTDRAGVNATTKGGETIREVFTSLGNIKQFDESHVNTDKENYACEIRVISPPEGKDPDEFVRSHGAEALREHIKNAPLLIDFELNNVLKRANFAKTPQDKAKITQDVIPILCEIHNKVIQGEYVKMAAAALDINESSLLSEVNKLSRFEDDNMFAPIIKPNISNVTKSSQINEIAQKNLLSVYLIEGNQITLPQISEMIPTDIFTDEMLIIVKTTIDKFTNTVNNVRGLREKLFTEYVEDTAATRLLTELVYIADSFKGLSANDLNQAIEDMKIKICRLANEETTKELKKQYSAANDDAEALKLQIALRDKLKLELNGDNK
ncbi:MAG: DNA primase [Candidatus Gastranaerophilales bacterium]|nr:DNA primase [Candidatus Gastranaerophilales bacterium]